MKRKSIFLTVVAVFLASVAWGQGKTWPSSSDFEGTGKKFVGADTIYFCAVLDSLYPIELGVDVAGVKLSTECGEWSLRSTSSSSVYAEDYDFDETIKNEGAGNAFRVVGSGIGGYIFQYVATGDLCDLHAKDTFLIYVFVLPSFDNVVSEDSLRCKLPTPTNGDPRPTITINSNDYFAEYIDLYNKAGFSASWTKGSGTIKADSAQITTFEDELNLTHLPSGYTCGSKGTFQFTMTIVDEVGQFTPVTKSICAADTVGSKANRNPNDILERSYPGTYSPATLGNTGWLETSSGSGIYGKQFIFSYTDCAGLPKTVNDSIYIMKAQGFWGVDTTVICREKDSLNIYAIYNREDIDYPSIPGKWTLIESNSKWKDFGVTGVAVPQPMVVPGTTDGLTSLDGYNVLFKNMYSSVGYHYQWYATGIECAYKGTPELPDSGVVVVILQDPLIAQDYTAQLCQDTYSATSFDLTAYTGVEAAWYLIKSDGTHVPVTGNNVTGISGLAQTTYKFGYDLASNCGPGGKGVFYLKVANKVKVSGSKTVKYCLKRLPSSINLNDVLNIAVSGLIWKCNTVSTLPGFTSDGILDIGTYLKAYPNAKTLEFEIQSVPTNSCVNTGVKLTIDITNDII
jgi:hypothetical protein